MKPNHARYWLIATVSMAATLHAANTYIQHNLVADQSGMADHTDASLVNPWGICASATSPFWFSDEGSGVSTLYSTGGSGSVPGLTVTIKPSATATQGQPTGCVYNSTTGFAVAAGKPAGFIFDGQDGTITAWNSSVDLTHALVMVDNSASGAVYKGLAIGTNAGATYLYATNFHAGTIEVYDTNFKPVTQASGAFTDPMIPSGFAPFNIQTVNGNLYVTYALQDAAKHNDVPGAGNGYVDVYNTAGTLMQHLIAGGPLNSPWGVALAPAGFGDYANDLLVGNFGDGWINVFNPTTGAFLASLAGVKGNTIAISGLWALQVGNGGSGGDKNAVYFTAGAGGEAHGLFGSLQAAPSIAADATVNAASFQSDIAPNTYITIAGANLSSTTRTWESSDFVNNALPIALDGVSVMVDGKAAYVYYISPSQINALTPASDTAQGAVSVQTTNNGLSSGTSTIQLQTVAPAFFLFSGGKYIAATHGDGSYVGTTTLFPNASTPAKPGETIVLYGTGFGPTTPSVPDGQLLTAALNLTTLPIMTFGGNPAQVRFAGLVSPGLYQINVTVPSSAPNGDVQVLAQAGGQTSPVALITVQQ
jgi:uncharacterized protein (TIGR03118 family)